MLGRQHIAAPQGRCASRRMQPHHGSHAFGIATDPYEAKSSLGVHSSLSHIARLNKYARAHGSSIIARAMRRSNRNDNRASAASIFPYQFRVTPMASATSSCVTGLPTRFGSRRYSPRRGARGEILLRQARRNPATFSGASHSKDAREISADLYAL